MCGKSFQHYTGSRKIARRGDTALGIEFQIQNGSQRTKLAGRLQYRGPFQNIYWREGDQAATSITILSAQKESTGVKEYPFWSTPSRYCTSNGGTEKTEAAKGMKKGMENTRSAAWAKRRSHTTAAAIAPRVGPMRSKFEKYDAEMADFAWAAYDGPAIHGLTPSSQTTQRRRSQQAKDLGIRTRGSVLEDEKYSAPRTNNIAIGSKVMKGRAPCRQAPRSGSRDVGRKRDHHTRKVAKTTRRSEKKSEKRIIAATDRMPTAWKPAESPLHEQPKEDNRTSDPTVTQLGPRSIGEYR
ncbi:hypothetical protein K438DRAFT_1757432 [Mycena galopus ATCC 62051]|nr:hypothetical protein K438DRAFT_1757432 [Mycena galopus ATCC 62051]